MSGTEPALMADLLQLASQLADAGRPIAMGYFRQPLEVQTKADHSPVTVADRMIEAEMRRLIAAQFPGHGIFGEEFGSTTGAEFTWVLDPIDGTRSFITGMPLFGSLIALVRGDEPVLGIIDFPAMGERWIGVSGQATRLNGEPARSSDCRSITQSRCYSTSPDMFKGQDKARFDALTGRAAMRRFGGDGYAYALLASGHCDLVIEAGLQPYDYLPLVPVIEGAGGRISDWQGKRLGFDSDGRVLAAASEALWLAAIEALC